MTLRELRKAHPRLFHPNQDWFEREAFMDRQAIPLPMPRAVWASAHGIPGVYEEPNANEHLLVSAATLCAIYVTAPHDSIWTDRYLWTEDKDSKGQRVYIGNNGLGLEIHRHLRITSRWGVPLWDHAA